MKNQQYDNPMRIYEARYRALDPAAASARSGCSFDAEKSQFQLCLLGTPLYADWPAFRLHGAEGCLDHAAVKLLVIRYLLEGTDAPFGGRFLSYRELPWGTVYDANFQGRCIRRLAFAFGNRPDAFRQAAEVLGAAEIGGADAAYEFSFLDKHRVRLLLWHGDEEFSPAAQILFSDDTALAFSAEDMAAVGDVIISRLQEVYKSLS